MFLRAIFVAMAVSLVPLSGAQAQQDAAAAERFVRDLYSHYRAGAAPFMPAFDSAPGIFTPAVVTLIRKDQEESDGEVGKLDIDPLCMCQDFDDIRIANLSTTPVQNGRTVATVDLVDGSVRLTVKITLAVVNNAWRVDDIQEGDEPSLRQVLR